MTPLRRRLVLALAVVGLFACADAFAGFIRTVMHNGLPWSSDLSAREFYQVVGEAYGRGFTVGFFFAFFLVILALAVSAGFERHRARRRALLRETASPAEVCEG